MLFFYSRLKPVCDAVLHDAQRSGGMLRLRAPTLGRGWRGFCRSGAR